MNDSINSPKHYTMGKHEAIEIIQDNMTVKQFEGYCIGNVLKYVLRHPHKGQLEDLKKAQWYLNRLILTKEGE